MSNRLSVKLRKLYCDALFGSGKHGDVRWYKGVAYVCRTQSQYYGWYSALTGKKLSNVYGINLVSRRSKCLK